MTFNLNPSLPKDGYYGAFLNASGRVLYDVFIYSAARSKDYRDSVLNGNDEPGYFIEVDANEVHNLTKHLKRYKLRAKVGIKVIEEEEWCIWQTWPEEIKPSLNDSSDIFCHDRRAPGMGLRIIRPRSRPPEEEVEATNAQYDLRRIMLGVAEGQSEIIKESALPQESNIDYMTGIDFRKGCYVGQELTIRTHHTGVVRKRILPVQIYDGGVGLKAPNELSYDQIPKLLLPPKGSNISRVDKKGRSAGRWLGGVGNVGLALCRLEVMSDTILTTEGSQWSPEDEFRIAWDAQEGLDRGEVKVKAFVPEWHKQRAEAQNLHGNKNQKIVRT